MFVIPLVILFLFLAPPLPSNPFCLHIKLTLLNYLEIHFLSCGANARPLLTLVGGILNPPHPPFFPPLP
jgi:hypothetical protein